MVVPSGPGLATIGKDQRYTKAVQNCDFAIPDSGYMVLLLRWLKGKKIRKFSGYVFLKHFFNDESFEKNELFLIDPTEKDSKVNNEYLNDMIIDLGDQGDRTVKKLKILTKNVSEIQLLKQKLLLTSVTTQLISLLFLLVLFRNISKNLKE